MRIKAIHFSTFCLALLLPLAAAGAQLGTRQQTIQPVALPTNTPSILASNIPNYAVYGYSSWQYGPGEDMGRLFLTPAETTSATNAARLLNFAALSDAHLTDKESPSQSLWLSYENPAGVPGNSSCYSPVILYTPQVLDAAVRTINRVHRVAPFDFAISLGDDCNGPQFNELRWFIDIMDGQYITPSSGTNAGAGSVDYQRPFQAAGLAPSIPWYAVLGNHDHFWLGAYLMVDYLVESMTNSTVLLMGNLFTDGINSRKDYLGVIDGTTPYGTVIDAGSVSNYIVGGVTNAPQVAPDPNRYGLTTSNWMSQFFNTTSQPVGHGFSLATLTNEFAGYSFTPKAGVPLKVIVLDDTMTDEDFDIRGQGGLDTNHFAWLTNELQGGQDAGQLMIIACHIPIELVAYGASTNSAITQSSLLATLHTYPNLLLWACGHLHQNGIVPQPSPDPAHPELGFWEVWTPSLRDWPKEFRTFDLLLNSDNTVSILTTDVDPDITPGTPMATAMGYAVAAARIFSHPCTSLADTSPYVMNAELIKTLSPAMQTALQGCGGPLGHRLDMEFTPAGGVINFLGTLQSASTLAGPWTDITDASPCALSPTNTAMFYRAVE